MVWRTSCLKGQVEIFDPLLDIREEGGLPELSVLPDCVVLYQGVHELYDPGPQLAAEGGGQRQDGGGHTVHVHVRVVLPSITIIIFKEHARDYFYGSN